MNPTRTPNEKPSQNPEVTHTADTRNPDWGSYVPQGHGHTDEQIRADVHEVLLDAETAGHASNLSVSVSDGIVTLAGSVRDAQQHERIAQRVRAMDSVRELRDELHEDATQH